MPQSDWKNRVEQVAVDILWSHWIKLGAYVDGKYCQASSDPESLLLLTGLMAKKDLRLLEVMGQWLAHYESVVNVERLKTALKLLSGESYIQVLTTFKKVLNENLPLSTKKRWNKILFLLGKEPANVLPATLYVKTETRKKLQTHNWILECNPLLGFRYAFGVAAKADIFYFLSVYSTQPQVRSTRPATGAYIARMLHYNPATVLRSLGELKDASMILCREASTEKAYAINSRNLYFSWPPKTDRFFLDWFSLIPVFQDIFSLDEAVSGRHESIVLDCLNTRLKVLDDVMTMVPRAAHKMYARKNLLGADQEAMWSSYVSALDEVYESLIQPRYLNWGADDLTQLLDEAQRNLWASYANCGEIRRIMDIDQIFMKATHLLNHHKNWFEGLFFMRCHSAVRAATRLSASGQLAESFALMRAALENALYAFHINCNAHLKERWIKRNDDQKSKKDCKNGFQITSILKAYKTYDLYNGPLVEKLYDHTIEYGAHPNPNSVFSNLEIQESEKTRTLFTLQLNTNEIPLKHALTSVARIGVSCLLILENIYLDRFQSSGLSEKIRGLAQGL